MRLFKLRGKAHRLGLLILEHGDGWQVTDEGVKNEKNWIVDTLEEVEELLQKIQKKMQKEENETYPYK
jgi:hypothetical protein